MADPGDAARVQMALIIDKARESERIWRALLIKADAIKAERDRFAAALREIARVATETGIAGIADAALSESKTSATEQ